MKKNRMFIIFINFLMCLLLCSCTKTIEDNFSNESNLGDSYVNIQFGTRSTHPGVEEDKELGVSRLRVIVFDSHTNKLEQNEVYAASNAGRVPNPLLKVASEQQKIVYVIANEEGKTTVAGTLSSVLESIKTQADLESVVVGVTPYNSMVDLPGTGLLMIGKGAFTAKFGNSMLNPQVVSLGLERLTSKIVINARRTADMTVKIVEIEAKNFYNFEYLIAKTPVYDYPAGSWINHDVPTNFDVPEKTAATFDNVGCYYLGTSFFQTDPTAHPTLIDVHYEITLKGGKTTAHVKTIEGLGAPRNNVIILNLNFEQATVDIKISVKPWDDVAIDGDVVGGTFASLSESELTMYNKYDGTIYFNTDASNVTVDALTQGGKSIDTYFSRISITPNSPGLGEIVLTPILAAMSQDPDIPTEIGLYFNFGNIRKLVKITHVNVADMYRAEYYPNGGAFSDGHKTKLGGVATLKEGYIIAPGATYIPSHSDQALDFNGWALTPTAYVGEFQPGERVSRERLGNPIGILPLYAVWASATRVALMFDPNGKITADMPDAVVGTPNMQVTIPANIPSVIGGGSAFKEWNTRADGTGVSYSPNTSYLLGTETSVLYAIWELTPVTVSLWNESATPVATYKVAIGSMFTITVPDPLPGSGYYFNGWNTAKDGSGTSYERGRPYAAPSSNLNLFAVVKKFHRVAFFTRTQSVMNDITGLNAGDQVDLSSHYNLFMPTDFIQGEGLNTYYSPIKSWRDMDGGALYDRDKGKFIMPARDVRLEAVYHSGVTFPLTLNQWGPTYSYKVVVSAPWGEFDYHSFVKFHWWGKTYTAQYPVDFDFSLHIHASWENSYAYRVCVKYQNGRVDCFKNGSGAANFRVRIWKTDLQKYGKVLSISIDPDTRD